MIMLQFMSFGVRLLGVNKIPIEADSYGLEGITKCSVEEFRNSFEIMLQKQRLK